MRSKHNPAHPGLHERPSAHRAWLKRCNQRAAVETPVAQDQGCLAQSDQFGMSKGILLMFPPVASMADAAACWIEHHGGDWNLPGLANGFSPRQQNPHPFDPRRSLQRPFRPMTRW